jgi:iron complex outermembrane receptor protein
MRLSGVLVNRGGYLRRLPPPAPLGLVEQANGRQIDLHREGDNHGEGGRLQLRWLVSDTLTADLSLDGTRKRDRQGPIHLDVIDPRLDLFPILNDLIRKGQLPGPEITNDFAPRNLLESYSGGRSFLRQDLWGVSLVLTKQLGRNTLKFTGAYRALRSHEATDVDGLYFDIAGSDLVVRQHQLSGELQLNGTAGSLTYTAGLFEFRETPSILPTTSITDVLYTCGCFYTQDNLPTLTADSRRLRSNSYAGYTQATYRISSRLSVTAGGRYTREKKELEGKSYVLDPAFGLTDVIVASGAAKDSWTSFTYRADVQYQATSDVMTYASVARGFKSGGFNVRGDPGLPNMGFTPFGPESAVTYEIGLKSQWLHRMLRLNATLFDSEYRDIQLRQQTFVGGIFTTLIENAARARIRGAEFELSAIPLAGLTVTAAYGHIAPKYLDVGEVRGLTLKSRFQRAPADTFSGSVNYEVPMLAGILELHGDYSYRSKEQFQILPATNDQDGYGLLGARVAFRTADNRWMFALFGTNLTDKRYRTAGRGTLIRQIGFAYSSVGMPRQIGVQVNTGF